MSAGALEASVRGAGARIRAALAARFRSLDLAEDAFAEAAARAVATWRRDGTPADPAAWLYRVATRAALDMLRRQRNAVRLAPDPPAPEPTAEDAMLDDSTVLPDERLRLILICCHPAIAPDARTALTLRVVCGFPTERIARAFLVPEPTLAQRLVRAKRKIAEAGVRFELPAREHWPARLEVVLATLEIAYAAAHEDAAGAAAEAGFGPEVRHLTALLAERLPDEPNVLALAATVRLAEARRPARLDAEGAMVPLSEQDPARWDAALIAEGHAFLARAEAAGNPSLRLIQARIHRLWCARRSIAAPAPWPAVLAQYDAMLALRDDPIVRLNRAVALAEVAGPGVALGEVAALDAARFAGYAPFHAVRADLLRRLRRIAEAREAYAAVLALAPPSAERRWLERRLAELG